MKETVLCLLDDEITVDDPDNTQLASATITITNVVDTEDELAYPGGFGLSATWDNVTGVLQISGSATLTDYAAALSTVTYENTSDAPDVTLRDVTLTVSDGIDTSPTFGMNIDVRPVNDPPVVNGSVTDLGYTEGDGQVAIDNSFAITDVDDTNIENASVSIAVNYTATEDVLAFTDQLGITGNWDAVTGILSMTGTAPLADYVTALEAITYENTEINPNVADRTLRVIINDGDDDSQPFERTIILAAVNNPPVVGCL